MNDMLLFSVYSLVRKQLSNCIPDIASVAAECEQNWIDLVWITCEPRGDGRSWWLGASWIRIHHTIHHLERPGCSPGRRADHEHVAKVAASCFYHFRRLRQIHRRVGTEVTTQLVQAFITSHLDYCNSVLAGLLQVTLEPLQCVQNAAVRLILYLNLCTHVTPGLRQLHWLPIRWRIQHKLCSIMQSIHAGRCPVYMAECVYTVAEHTSQPSLHGGVRSYCRWTHVSAQSTWRSAFILSLNTRLIPGCVKQIRL